MEGRGSRVKRVEVRGSRVKVQVILKKIIISYPI